MTPVLTCLVGRLEDVSSHRVRLADAMHALKLRRRDVAEYAHFSDATYTRNLIRRTEDVEIVLICWKPNQKTPIHNHPGADGWIYCIHGEIEEVRYDCRKWDGGEGAPGPRRLQSTIVRRGEVGYINDEMAWHSIEHVGAGEAMTLHVYAPPVDICGVYDAANTGYRTRQMEYYSVEGVVRGGR